MATSAQDSAENAEQTGIEEESSSQDIEEKLKGDAIGSTMYTQRFVLNTLLKLKDIKWDESLEEDLCFLWDSTMEKEVCEYLMNIEFPLLACSVILQNKVDHNGRLIEILVGILANIITANCDEQLEANHVDVVLSLLTCSDSLVLIQVMRFIGVYSMHNKNFLTEERSEDLGNILEFILTNSTNFELIQTTLEALSKITESSKIKVLFRSVLLKTSVLACIRSVTEDLEKDFELFSQEQRKSVKHLLEYIVNFCVFINQANELSINDSKICSDSYVELLSKIIEWFSIQENLLPLTEELVFYILASNYILLSLKIDYDADIFRNITKILGILIENEVNDINEFIEMFCYFIHKGNVDDLKNDIKSFGTPYIKTICKYLDKQELDFDFIFDKHDLRKLY